MATDRFDRLAHIDWDQAPSVLKECTALFDELSEDLGPDRAHARHPPCAAATSPQTRASKQLGKQQLAKTIDHAAGLILAMNTA